MSLSTFAILYKNVQQSISTNDYSVSQLTENSINCCNKEKNTSMLTSVRRTKTIPHDKSKRFNGTVKNITELFGNYT